MKKTVKYIGLDVHKNSISIGIADEGRDGEIRYYGKIDNNMDQLTKFSRKLISQGAELRCVYEAGSCGYHIYRYLTSNGIKCEVIAPSKTPQKSGDHLKNDKRDCLSLARLHRAGELTPIYVPNEEDEALRDLVRARADTRNAHKRAKQQLKAFLLRHHKVFPGKTSWSKTYFNWLADLKMKHPAQHIALQEYIDTVNTCNNRVARLTEQILLLSQESRLWPLIAAIQSLRGVALLTAATIASELGDIRRFERPTQLMAFLGLIPSEHSSGNSIKKGSITKAGNTHVRKALIESAHAYRLPARITTLLARRQEHLAKNVCEISWNAQLRLCGRYRRLRAKGKNDNVVKTAVARELSGFIWDIAMKTPLAV
jgi:transposase